jgi:hypothetical protein
MIASAAAATQGGGEQKQAEHPAAQALAESMARRGAVLAPAPPLTLPLSADAQEDLQAVMFFYERAVSMGNAGACVCLPVRRCAQRVWIPERCVATWLS